MKLRQKFEYYNFISTITPIALIGVVSIAFLIIAILKFPVEELFLTRTQLLNPLVLIQALGQFFTAHPLSVSYLILYVVLCIMIFVTTNTIFTRRLASSLEKPIRELRDNIDKIRDGSFSFNVMGSDYDELDNLAEGFDSMRRSLMLAREREELLKEERNMLIANISHDLRTPITSIKGYIDGINDGVANTPEKMRQYLNTIKSKANIIDELVANLSTFSKLEGSQLEFAMDYGDLRDLVYDILDSYRIDFENAGITIDADLGDAPMPVKIDGEKMRRVFSNIIGNSLKYRRADSRLLIVSGFTDEGNAYITIEDDGMGIEPDELTKVFDSFYRTDQSRTSQIKGNGLGLGIAKQITEKHNGRLWLRSNGTNTGTTATICLPLVQTLEDKDEKGINY